MGIAERKQGTGEKNSGCVGIGEKKGTGGDECPRVVSNSASRAARATLAVSEKMPPFLSIPVSTFASGNFKMTRQ